MLTLNGGSSSIKFAVYKPGEAGTASPRGLSGQLDRISQPIARFTVRASSGAPPSSQPVAVASQGWLVDWLAQQRALAAVRAVGHRVVFGGAAHQMPEVVTPALLADLTQLIACDPDHLPAAIVLIEAVAARYPQLRQVACFDTAFHRAIPRVAQQLPLLCGATACPTPTCWSNWAGRRG